MHDLGYELFEIRSGYGALPVARLGNHAPEATVDAVRAEFSDVLAKALGEDGQRKRENVRRMCNALADGWKPDGVSWKEIDRIIDVAMAKHYH